MRKPSPDPETDARDIPDTRVRRQAFSVPLSYDVVFTRDAFDPRNPALVDVLTRLEPARRHRVLAVVDRGVADAWPEARGWIARIFDRHAARLALAAPPVVVPGGEAAKNDPALVPELHRRFFDHHLDRHSFVLVLGGGGVQDAVGFAAATAHRGLRLVRMPTTVLAQCDSGVGVKNGVNAFGTKNFIGTFAPPFAVVSDSRFLDRLPVRDRIAGLAEAVKVALIRDAAFFAWIEERAPALRAGDPRVLAEAIFRCADLHMRHIASGGDPFELGSARPLDFGHWAAHKLETLSEHDLRHGEAVAIGLLLDCRYSVEAGLLAAPAFARIERVLAALGLPRWHPSLEARVAGGRRVLLAGLDEFREHLGGDLTITLLRAIGDPVDVGEMDAGLIERALAWASARADAA